ncbi:MAG: M48 family metalloprotease [Planctomycetota bacterium]
MQLVLIGLALALLLHDAPEAASYLTRLDPLPLLAVVLLPKLLIAGLYLAACRHTVRQLGKPRGARALLRLHRFSAVLPVFTLASFGLDLWAGALAAVRAAPPGRITGPRDTVLLDELAVLALPLLLLAWSWWAYYPIDRRVRDAALIRRADTGLPLYPPWTRGQYVLTQARNHAALVLGPLLILLAWAECLVKLHAAGLLSESAQLWLTPAGAGVLFLLAPLIVRRLWDTVPLPPGPVRDRLDELCQLHRVRVRQLLLWRTYGGSINAAVMGLFGPLRYILLTDGLLEQVRPREVEAVMAHELGHVRGKHLGWLLAAAVAAGLVLSAAGQALDHHLSPLLAPAARPWFHALLSAAGLVLWALAFGWVSRRIERQADTFAARHLTTHPPKVPPEAPPEVPPEAPPETPSETLADAADADARPPRFHPDAVGTMIRALQQVADLNHIPAHRRSWRHGSITWRQAHLRSLIDTPLHGPPIDHQVNLIRVASLAVLFAAALWNI